MEDKTWRPSKKKYGVAICNYKGHAEVAQSLPLCVGQSVHIFEEYGSGSTAWYRGSLMSNKDKMGVFPACIVHIKQCHVQNEGLYETVTPLEDVMVREVGYVLWEWNNIWKRLYVKNNELFEKIRASMEELIMLRGQLADKKLTEEEGNDIKNDIVSVIDWGNGQLDLDLVPRIDGEPVDADSCSLVQLYRVHVNASKIALAEKPQRKRRKTMKTSKGEMVQEAGLTTHHVLVRFVNFGCNVGDNTETLLGLYQYKDNKLVALTEKFLVRYTSQMVPMDIEKLDDYYGLFTDLSTEEIEKDLYLVAHIYRIGGMKPEHTKKVQKEVFKRPWGVGVSALNLARLTANYREWEYQMKVVCCADNEFTGLHEQLIEKLKDGTSNPLNTSSKLGLTLTMSLQILHGDLATVKKEEPMLFSRGVAQIQKMGFTDDLSPGEVRNDLYVTMKKADLDRGSKKSQKNVEVKVTVFGEKDGQYFQIENCLSYGCGEPPSSEYHTSVHYHSNRPEWNETIRISVPIDIFPGSHICFELFHCSVSDSKKEKREPYGIAYVRVTNDSQIVISDSAHDLIVYKTDDRHPWSKTDFFKLPFLVEDLNDPHKIPHFHNKMAFRANEKESLTIQTLLCSGKFTQNSDLLGILNWRGEQFAGKLDDSLEKLCKMPGDEIVKFLHDIMDALFDMLMDNNSSKKFAHKIFKSMINIFTLIHHVRFETFKPVLEAYISDTFSATLVHKPLCDCFTEMIDLVCREEGKTNMQLIQSFQDMDYIFRFIIQSRQLQRKDVFSRGSGDAREFHNNLQNVFKSMGDLLSSTSDKLKPYQVALLSHLHLVYSPLLVLVSENDVAEFVRLILQDMPGVSEIPEDITRTKLELMQKTVATKLFTHEGSRNQLLPLCLEEVKQCYNGKILMRSATDLLCDVMDAIFKLKQDFPRTCLVDIGTSGVKEDIEKIIQTMFDVVMITILDLKDTFSTKDRLLRIFSLRLKRHFSKPRRAAENDLYQYKNLRKQMMEIQFISPRRKRSDLGFPAKPTVSLLDWMKQQVGRDSGFDSSSEDKSSQRLSYDGSPDRTCGETELEVPYGNMAVVNWSAQTSTSHGSMIACLMEMLRLMEGEHYDTLLHIYHRGEHLKIFLVRILEVFQQLVQPQVFPQDWIVMRMVTNNIVFTSMEYFSDAIKDNYRVEDKFDKVVWTHYFKLAVEFITQSSLQLNRYSEVKAQKLRDRYQDMRVLMGHQAEGLWQSLGKHKKHFIPSMVGAFVELTLVPEVDVRKVTLPVIVDMMDWDQKFHGNFHQVEAAMIERLDYFLTQQHLGDTQYMDLFHKTLIERVQSEPSLKNSGGPEFITSVSHLLERLLDYRQVVDGDENKDKRMHCTFNLLNFYDHEIDREEMYIRYVNKLHNLHMLASNHAEAGLTLQLYAKVLKWSDNTMPEEMGYKQEKERDRKEALYMQIINCFDKGKVWEYALPLCKDLAEYYERNLDYKKLSDILKQEAQFYEKILEGVPGDDPSQRDTFYPRQDPAYYRVAYYGQSFPAFVRNKQFIYRGDECLKLQTIMNHLTAEYPSAQIMSNTNVPNDDIKDGEQQYIQICAVKPVPQERPEFRDREVPLEIRNFYNFNEVDTFQFDKPYYRGKKDPENEAKTLCIERTKMKTAYKFPGILRWYEVKEFEIELLCPIRVAIETVKQSNSDLQMLITRCQMNPGLFFTQLEMKLQGIISANVGGGIAKYHEAFFTKEFEREHPTEVHFLDVMKLLLHEQVKILKRGMTMHAKLVPDNLMPLHRSLNESLKKLMKDVAEHSSPYNSTVSLKSLDFGRPGTPGSSSISSLSSFSDRTSIHSQDDIVVHPEDLPFNLAAHHKSSRSYVPFPEEGCGTTPPPIPSRPQSMLLSPQGMSQMTNLPGSRGKTGSDPMLMKPESPQQNVIRVGKQHVSRAAKTTKTFSVADRPPPQLPSRDRRPSDPGEFRNADLSPQTPTIDFSLDGGPPKLPQKNPLSKTVTNGDVDRFLSPTQTSGPPLPPRKLSVIPTTSDHHNTGFTPTPRPRNASESSSRPSPSSPLDLNHVTTTRTASNSPHAVRPRLSGLQSPQDPVGESPTSEGARPPPVPRRSETSRNRTSNNSQSEN